MKDLIKRSNPGLAECGVSKNEAEIQDDRAFNGGMRDKNISAKRDDRRDAG